MRVTKHKWKYRGSTDFKSVQYTTVSAGSLQCTCHVQSQRSVEVIDVHLYPHFEICDILGLEREFDILFQPLAGEALLPCVFVYVSMTLWSKCRLVSQRLRQLKIVIDGAGKCWS
jgi:hypothetical protein